MPDVSTPSLAYNEMAEKWDMLHALLGGTFTMRAAREMWLPKEPKEEFQTYEVRLSRSFLYEAYKSTLKKLSSKPFTRPVTLGDLPDQLAPMQNSADNAGTSLTQFAKACFEAGLTYGLTHVLVDFPQISESMSLADERSTGVRPTMVHIKAPDMLSWSSKLVLGQRVLTSIRYKEIRTTVADYKETSDEYVRVLTEAEWELWKKTGDKWALEKSGLHTFGAVPLVTVYVSKTGYMQGEPPLEGLAHMNIAHWQSQSDQRNILRFARSGVIVATGVTEDEIPNLILGPNHFIHLSNKDAKVGYVEHTGKAIEAGEKDLQRLEERMETLGMQPMIQRTAQATATAKIIEEGKTQSDIQAWIRGLETMLADAFEMASKWMALELREFKVDIFSDFAITERSTAEVDTLSKMAMAGQLSIPTLLKETKRRAILSEDLDVDKEMERIAVDFVNVDSEDGE